MMAQFGLVIKTKTFHKLDNMQNICRVSSKVSNSDQTMNSDQLQTGAVGATPSMWRMVPSGRDSIQGGSHQETSITAGLKIGR